MGFTSICGETAGCEANLAHFIKANKEKHQVKLLFPCGDLRLETLRLSLNEQSKTGLVALFVSVRSLLDFFVEDIAVEFVEVYQTSAHPKLASIIHENLETQVRIRLLFFNKNRVRSSEKIVYYRVSPM
jgi:hypothetical protein